MPKLRKTKTTAMTKGGKKSYDRYYVNIPKLVVKLMKWETGDNIEFDLNREDMENRRLVIRRSRE